MHRVFFAGAAAALAVLALPGVLAAASSQATPFDPPAGRPGGHLRLGETATLLSTNGMQRLQVTAGQGPITIVFDTRTPLRANDLGSTGQQR